MIQQSLLDVNKSILDHRKSILVIFTLCLERCDDVLDPLLVLEGDVDKHPVVHHEPEMIPNHDLGADLGPLSEAKVLPMMAISMFKKWRMMRITAKK